MSCTNGSSSPSAAVGMGIFKFPQSYRDSAPVSGFRYYLRTPQINHYLAHTLALSLQI